MPMELELDDVVERIARVFDRHKVPHSLIGGLAYGYRTRPRVTKDADFIVRCPAVTLPAVLDDLIADGFEFELIPFIRKWQDDYTIAFYRKGIRIDWLRPKLTIYNSVIDSAELIDWLGTPLRMATPEGIILTKMLAFRPRDQLDIIDLIDANRQSIDPSFIKTNWEVHRDSYPDRTAWLEAQLGTSLL